MYLLIKVLLIKVMMEDYEFELEKAKKEIKHSGAKKVLIQLPDGLKPQATKIVDELSNDKVEISIWAGSCFGACDIPHAEVDLIVQFGHTAFK